MSSSTRRHSQGPSKKGSRKRKYPPAELKYWDDSPAATNVADTGTVMPSTVLDIAQGTASTERIGRLVAIRSIHLRGHIQMNQDSSTTANHVNVSEYVRVIVAVDHQCNGAVIPAFNYLVQGATVRGFRNLDYTKRFTVLKDELIPVSTVPLQVSGTTQQNTGARIPFVMNIKCDIPITFTGSTGVVAQRPQNNIVIAACGSFPSSVDADRLQLQYVSRVRYYDS